MDGSKTRVPSAGPVPCTPYCTEYIRSSSRDRNARRKISFREIGPKTQNAVIIQSSSWLHRSRRRTCGEDTELTPVLCLLGAVVNYRAGPEDRWDMSLPRRLSLSLQNYYTPWRLGGRTSSRSRKLNCPCVSNVVTHHSGQEEANMETY